MPLSPEAVLKRRGLWSFGAPRPMSHDATILSCNDGRLSETRYVYDGMRVIQLWERDLCHSSYFKFIDEI